MLKVAYPRLTTLWSVVLCVMAGAADIRPHIVTLGVNHFRVARMFSVPAVPICEFNRGLLVSRIRTHLIRGTPEDPTFDEVNAIRDTLEKSGYALGRPFTREETEGWRREILPREIYIPFPLAAANGTDDLLTIRFATHVSSDLVVHSEPVATLSVPLMQTIVMPSELRGWPHAKHGAAAIAALVNDGALPSVDSSIWDGALYIPLAILGSGYRHQLVAKFVKRFRSGKIQLFLSAPEIRAIIFHDPRPSGIPIVSLTDGDSVLMFVEEGFPLSYLVACLLQSISESTDEEFLSFRGELRRTIKQLQSSTHGLVMIEPGASVQILEFADSVRLMVRDDLPVNFEWADLAARQRKAATQVFVRRARLVRQTALPFLTEMASMGPQMALHYRIPLTNCRNIILWGERIAPLLDL